MKTMIRRLVLLASLSLSSVSLAAGGSGGMFESGSQDPDYTAGEAAIKAKNWPQAIASMTQVAQREPDNADAENWLGYAYRKSGDLPNAFRHYERALAINPGHRGAHEYLGEAYLQAGDLAKAEQQLAALDKLCWLPCEAYRELKEKIADFRKSKVQ